MVKKKKLNEFLINMYLNILYIFFDIEDRLEKMGEKIILEKFII